MATENLSAQATKSNTHIDDIAATYVSADDAIRAKCDDMRRFMWKAGDISRDLWRMVQGYVETVNHEKGIRGTPRYTLMVVLYDTCTKAFDAWKDESATIAYSIKAMRILAKDMRPDADDSVDDNEEDDDTDPFS
jgi:hypothetical protein